MKANEAPEKIYLDYSMSTDTAGELWLDALWFDTKVSDDNIEYVRKDAFIEKVESFLNRKDDRDSYTIGYIKRHLNEIIKEVGL